jgi:hypothetical protein
VQDPHLSFGNQTKRLGGQDTGQVIGKKIAALELGQADEFSAGERPPWAVTADGQALRSPVRPEVVSYGSAFSRGILIQERDTALIQVSGTAAIDEAGKSLYPDNIRAQDGSQGKLVVLVLLKNKVRYF